jgi:hypothetical protein
MVEPYTGHSGNSQMWGILITIYLAHSYFNRNFSILVNQKIHIWFLEIWGI